MAFVQENEKSLFTHWSPQNKYSKPNLIIENSCSLMQGKISKKSSLIELCYFLIGILLNCDTQQRMDNKLLISSYGVTWYLFVSSCTADIWTNTHTINIRP